VVIVIINYIAKNTCLILYANLMLKITLRAIIKEAIIISSS